MMNSGFTRGLIIGGIVGATVSMAMNNNGKMTKTRRKMMRSGRDLFRKSGQVIGDVVDLFR